MKAEIISIGTELLMGELTDTNAPFIASRLPPLGIRLIWVSQVGDDLDMLAEAFAKGLARSDIIFTTGGLGPTQDDLTREAVAKALGEKMAVDDGLMEQLREFFRGRGTDMPSTNIKQATLIPSAQSIPNRRGTAPGWWVEKGQKIIVSMPGPPGELAGMWAEEVGPRLGGLTSTRGEVILTRNIKTAGLSEGSLDEMVAAYLGKENPYLGIYAKSDGIHLRIIARAPDEEAARKLIEPVERGLLSIVGSYVWGYDDETPQQTVGLLLAQKNLSLATMESCTGGLLASSITEVPDCHRYYKGGLFIDGSNGSDWENNGVPEAIVRNSGIVSQEAAEAMARAAGKQIKADIGIGVTGVAGPEEIEDKPVGTIHIAILTAWDGAVKHFSGRYPPRRSVIKQRAASTALIELRRLLSAM